MVRRILQTASLSLSLSNLIPANSAQGWISGDGFGSDSTDVLVGQATSYDNCIQLVKESEPDANGATVVEGGVGSCWAEFNMEIGQHIDTTSFETIIFEDDDYSSIYGTEYDESTGFGANLSHLWSQGDGSGPNSQEFYVGHATSYQNCIDLVRNEHPSANGATVVEGGVGACWAEINMESVLDLSGYETINFDDVMEEIFEGSEGTFDNFSQGNSDELVDGWFDAASSVQCGSSGATISRSSRILNGDVQDRGTYPWMVALFYYQNGVYDQYTHPFCAGTLISDRFVLTASSCIYDFMEEIHMTFGTHNVMQAEKEFQSLMSTKWWIHPSSTQYDYINKNNIAIILITSGKVQFNQFTKPICLPMNGIEHDILSEVSSSNPEGETDLLIAGWGEVKLNSWGKYSDELKAGYVKLIDKSTCEELHYEDIHENNICAGMLDKNYKNGLVDICDGDIGGPLAFQDSDGTWGLLGLSSSSFCGQKNMPPVFVRITPYLRWINNTISRFADSEIIPEDSETSFYDGGEWSSYTWNDTYWDDTYVDSYTDYNGGNNEFNDNPNAQGINEVPNYNRTWSCGQVPMRANEDRNNRIVGGQEAPKGYFPWQVGVASYYQGAPWCGGSLVSPRFVVSACHCFESDPWATYWLSIGDHDNSVNEGSEQWLRSLQVFMHPNWDSSTIDNDIAVIQLDGEVKFDNNVQPICLNRQEDRFESESTYNKPNGKTDLLVSGWGNMNDNGENYPDKLQYVAVKPINYERCSNDFWSGLLTNSMACAGYTEGEKDSCQGDSGGPLAFEDDEGVWTLYGVVSWGGKCAAAKLPGIYAKVSIATAWIDGIVGLSADGNDVTESGGGVTVETSESADAVSEFTCGAPVLGLDQDTTLTFSRIIGGDGAPIGSFPWQVAVSDSISGIPFCSGALISQRYVVSSAPNLADRTSVWLAFGQDNWGFTQEQTQNFKSAHIIMHENFVSSSYDFGLALIEIDGLVEFNDYISPVCIPSINEDFGFNDESSVTSPEGRTNLYVSGWGSTAEQGPISEKLNYALVKPINQEVCQHWYSDYGSITNNMMCAGYEMGETDTCRGDGGAPLVSRTDGAWVLHGLSSWGVGCALAGFPTVYANVGSMSQWIYDNSDLTDVTINRPFVEDPATVISNSSPTVSASDEISESLESELSEISEFIDPSGMELTCTKTTSKDSTLTRVVGGQHAMHGAFPWQVAFSDYRGGSPWCGGSILSKTWVVSAAHCFQNGGKVWMMFGADDWTNPTGVEQYLSSKRIINHEDYDDTTIDNDIALIETFGEITFNEYIMPICFDQDTSRFEGETDWFKPEGSQKLYVSGWGSINAAGTKYPNELQYADVRPINSELCASAMSATENMICAGYTAGGIDACSGDSGGPLAYLNEDDVWVLYGIVSWGFGCAEADMPGVYTKVANYVDWVNSKTGITFGMSLVDDEESTEVIEPSEETESETTQPDPTCGYAPLNNGDYTSIVEATRISNGIGAQQGWFPWEVALMDQGFKRKPFCSGSLINSRWVLTAAHCVSSDVTLSTSLHQRSGNSQSQIFMAFGMTKWLHKQEGVQETTSKMVIIHPQYSDLQVINDIAMIMTSDEIIFSEIIQPICLNYNSEPFVDELSWATPQGESDLFVAGWGSTVPAPTNFTVIWGDHGGLGSDTDFLNEFEDDTMFTSRGKQQKDRFTKTSTYELHYAKLNPLYSEHCSIMHGTLHSSQICAGLDTDSQIEICAGDAGAPLAYRFKKSWTLVGVASWGFGCNRQGMPGVYAKVSEFTSWIDFTVAKG